MVGVTVEEVLHGTTVLLTVVKVTLLVVQDVVADPLIGNLKFTLVQHHSFPLSPPPGLSPQNPDETTGNLCRAAGDRERREVTEIRRSEPARNAGWRRRGQSENYRLVLESVSPRELQTPNESYSSICFIGEPRKALDVRGAVWIAELQSRGFWCSVAHLSAVTQWVLVQKTLRQRTKMRTREDQPGTKVETSRTERGLVPACSARNHPHLWPFSMTDLRTVL